MEGSWSNQQSDFETAQALAIDQSLVRRMIPEKAIDSAATSYVSLKLSLATLRDALSLIHI